MTKVLIVEDDGTVRDTLALNLQAEGYEVFAAEDGEVGLALAREEDPYLVVLDVMLPELTALTVCPILGKESPVPIILLTARGTETDKIIGLEMGYGASISVYGRDCHTQCAAGGARLRLHGDDDAGRESRRRDGRI